MTNTQPRYDIFISYAAADNQLAQALVRRLTSEGFEVAAPYGDYTPATPSRDTAIVAGSDMAIYIASRHSNRLRKSVDEITVAARRCRAVVMVVTDDSALPSALPRPTVYRLPTVDFRRNLPSGVLIDRLVATVRQVSLTGSVYSDEQREQLHQIESEAAEARSKLGHDEGCEAAIELTRVIEKLEALPAYPPTLLARAYSDLATAHYQCHDYRAMYEADEQALALSATEELMQGNDANYRLAVAVARQENPTRQQLEEAMSLIEAAIYDHRMENPSDTEGTGRMLAVKRQLAERMAL